MMCGYENSRLVKLSSISKDVLEGESTRGLDKGIDVVTIFHVPKALISSAEGCLFSASVHAPLPEALSPDGQEQLNNASSSSTCPSAGEQEREHVQDAGVGARK